MRVLITGGTGRLGINVGNTFLQNGFQVRVLDLDNRRNRKNVRDLSGKAEIMWGDVTQPDSVRKAIEGVDAVIHMAAILPPLAYEKPELATKVNVGGTRTIVDLIKEKGRRLPLVYTSSVAVFGPTPEATELINPDKHEPHPQGIYAETKFQAENLIKGAGIDYVILRLSVIMYLTFEISDLKRMFTVPLNNRTEFCHPDDLALAILNAVKNFDTVKGKTLVISGGCTQQMLYKDIVGTLLRVVGMGLPPTHKFTTEPYYLDWYDTSKSQELLCFQRKTFADYLKDSSQKMARRYSPIFIPLMRYCIGPLFGKIIVRLL